ncbi:hypothetical protein D9757_002149 [Collybiopsis confluens]|uniref:Uncharacterized protein n=1 Tax=Collybiopsis confluens TaxID=2823264 RepID=A0A8H5MFV0_9AGAR|nr:hypothetical protein D9757_002149 [Collybiopsis confluens]
MESIYQQSNYSLTSITSDELRWLDADALFLQDSPPSPTHFATSRSSPRPRTTSRAKRPHYQRSTKSSSAKSISRLSGSSNRRHSRSNYVILPNSSPPTSPISSPRLTASTSLPIKTPPRLTKRTASYSSTHGGSPGSEWIYRRPKSPSTSSPPRTSAIKYTRRNASASDSNCTPSPASTAENSRSVTPTSTTYRSGLANNYFPNVSTSYLNASSSSLPAHIVNSRDAGGNNGSGSSIGSIGSIGVLVPSSFGFDSSVSSLSRQPSSATSSSSSGPSKASLANEKSSTFWTSILPSRSDSTGSGSRIGRLTLGKSKAKERSPRPQPSSPLAVHTSATIPSIWSGANVEGANGTSPKRRKARGSLKELGISRIPVSSRIVENISLSSTSLPPPPPIYNAPVKRRPSHTRSESLSSTTSSSTSSALFTNSASSLSSSSPPLTPVSPTFPGIASNNKSKKKFEPHHRVIVEVVEDDDASQMDIQRRKSPSPTKSILASSRGETPPGSSSTSLLGLPGIIELKKNQRKDSVSTTISSNKSVKFAEQPIVHYASAIYESWDGTTGAGPFDYNMGRDIGAMDVDEDGRISEETAQPHIFDFRSHPYASSDLYLPAGGGEDNDADLAAAEASDTVSAHLDDFNSRLVHARVLRTSAAQESTQTKSQTQTPETVYQSHREENCITPTPPIVADRGRVRTSSSGSTGTSTLRSFASLKRKSSSASSTTSSVSKRVPSASPSRSITPRPLISGPYALGSLQTHPGLSPHGSTAGCNADSSMGMRSAGLRSAPSLESFKSGKSGKSGKSMRSLKSLPERSLRGMKEMRDWFRGRVTVNAI